MSRRKRIPVQQVRKKRDKRCFFCLTTDYALLAAHRIIPGSKYHWLGLLTCCANCHIRIHDGQMIVHGRYLCTDSRYYIHFTDESGEHWLPEQQPL